MSRTTERLNETQREFLQKLNSLDFSPLAYKLMNPEDRPGLSLEQAADAITKYKGFLFLTHNAQGRAVSPSRYVDYVWHTHVLDTELYLTQTATLFGRQLHHFPYFGKRGNADEKELLAAADYTKEQARLYFGWDDDDWCGTRPKGPHGPRALEELAGIIYPAGLPQAGVVQGQDTISIQVGNFLHTVQHIGSPTANLFGSRLSHLEVLEKLLKLPIWVIVCMPADLATLGELVQIRRDKLADVTKTLLEQRPQAPGFRADMAALNSIH
ncbi:hypothetical protein GCM10027277_01750 [Pseudoduganella ginsengisoli]|uniref:Uncharacterized protein n=1 Tax=Pseudoduganella ginsengisoli TaxID=1462440 RepID=A0A6L6Q8Q8_9BURK|nr:hypothetical protein [Pseudoduganella ginsengisoli]MTW05844.1 hypothetical protein [Pseudoduganella ginsengisoli]